MPLTRLANCVDGHHRMGRFPSVPDRTDRWPCVARALARDLYSGSAPGGVHVAENDWLLLQVEVMAARLDGHGRTDGAFNAVVV